ncbi:MAG: hypothetical protein WD055_04360 [Candidatus Dependentiae bacterium]
MRTFLLFALLASAPISILTQKNELPSCHYQGDTFDYGAMLTYCSQKIESFAPRLEALQDDSQEMVLEPTNEQERNDMLCAYTSFLKAVFRMRQEIACIDDETAHLVASAIWYSMHGVFQLFAAEVQKEAINEVIDWIKKHADDTWEPQENVDAYKPKSQWAALRKEEADDFSDLLREIEEDL